MRLTAALAATLVSLALLAGSAHAYSVLSDSAKQQALIDMIEAWVPHAEGYYCDGTVRSPPRECADFISEKTDGYYRGYGDGVDIARGNASIAIAYATLFASDPSRTRWGGIAKSVLEDHVHQAIRYVAFTNDAYGYGPDPWGGTACLSGHCLAPNMAAGLAWATQLMWSRLASTTRTAVTRVVATEANIAYDEGPKDASGNLTTTFAEENTQVVGLLAAAHAFFGGSEPGTTWADGAKDFAYNTPSRAADESDGTVLDGRTVASWVHTVNLYRDFTLGNHGFFHPVYLQGLYNDLSNAAVFYSVTSLSVPSAFHFRLEEVWNSVLGVLSWDDGDLVAPAGTDWMTHDYQHIQYLAYSAALMGSDHASVMESRAIELLQARQAENGDGSLYDHDFLGYETENIRTLAGAWWVHEQFGPTPEPTQRAYDADVATRDGVVQYRDQYVIAGRMRDAFVSMSWDQHATGMIVPRAEGFLGDPITMQNWPQSVIGDDAYGEDHSFGCRCESNFFSTAGVVNDIGARGGRRFSMTAFDDGITILLDRGIGRAFTFAFENDQSLIASRPVYYSGGTMSRDGTIPGTWLNVADRIGVITKGGSGQELETIEDNDGPYGGGDSWNDMDNPKFLVTGTAGTGNGNRGAFVVPLAGHEEMEEMDDEVDLPTVPSSDWSALTAIDNHGVGRIAVAYWGAGTATGTVRGLTSSLGAPIPGRPNDVIVSGSRGDSDFQLTGKGSTGERANFFVSSTRTVTVRPISETLIKLTNGGASNTVTVNYDDGPGVANSASATLAAGTVAYAVEYDGGVAIVTPSASTTDGSHPAALAFDGNTSTYWSSAATSTLSSRSPECLVLDMGTAVALGRVTMVPRSGFGPKDYVVQTADSSTACNVDTGWTTKATVTSATDGRTQNHSWTAVSRRYVRIKVTAAHGSSPFNVGIKELTPAPS